MACNKNKQAQPSMHASDLPFYNRLMNIKFPDASSATKYCQTLCAEYGYTAKQEAKNASGTIYIVCEGYINEHIKRSSIVLSETDPPHWTFQVRHESQNDPPSKIVGEEVRISPEWPTEVNTLIANLIQHQQLEAQDIRDTIQRQFPDLVWNERRFQHQLIVERQRQKESTMATRVSSMIQLSAQLCAVVAANEESAQNVERDLIKMLDHFSHLARLTPDRLDSLVDLEATTTEMTKKRKSADNDKQKGVQCVSIPGFNVHVRAHPLRASSLSSQGSRRTSDSSALSSPAYHRPTHDSTNFVLSQQVDDLINLTYHHSIHAPFSPNETPLTTQADATQSFLGEDHFWSSAAKDPHRSSARFTHHSTLPPSNVSSSCSDPNPNAIFY